MSAHMFTCLNTHNNTATYTSTLLTRSLYSFHNLLTFCIFSFLSNSSHSCTSDLGYLFSFSYLFYVASALPRILPMCGLTVCMTRCLYIHGDVSLGYFLPHYYSVWPSQAGYPCEHSAQQYFSHMMSGG